MQESFNVSLIGQTSPFCNFLYCRNIGNGHAKSHLPRLAAGNGQPFNRTFPLGLQKKFSDDIGMRVPPLCLLCLSSFSQTQPSPLVFPPLTINHHWSVSVRFLAFPACDFMPGNVRQIGADMNKGDGPPYSRSSRVSASPNRSSFTPIRSMIDKYKLHILRLSGPWSK